jgi:hypothetical protein
VSTPAATLQNALRAYRTAVRNYREVRARNLAAWDDGNWAVTELAANDRIRARGAVEAAQAAAARAQAAYDQATGRRPAPGRRPPRRTDWPGRDYRYFQRRGHAEGEAMDVYRDPAVGILARIAEIDELIGVWRGISPRPRDAIPNLLRRRAPYERQLAQLGRPVPPRP